LPLWPVLGTLGEELLVWVLLGKIGNLPSYSSFQQVFNKRRGYHAFQVASLHVCSFYSAFSILFYPFLPRGYILKLRLRPRSRRTNLPSSSVMPAAWATSFRTSAIFLCEQAPGLVKFTYFFKKEEGKKNAEGSHETASPVVPKMMFKDKKGKSSSKPSSVVKETSWLARFSQPASVQIG